MDRVKLNNDISDVLEKVDPMNNPIEQVSEDDCLPAFPSVSPSLLHALLFRCFGKFAQVFQYIELVGQTKVNMTFIVVAELGCCECP